ncbi:MAG: hypothetical protein PHP82_03830 [Candidatus ainarchaeum sp.]|nr:hypothetical protein [Candidatus ainarchaeum sp.]
MSDKICIFCKLKRHARLKRFYTHNGQSKNWVCVFCLENNGGARQVQEILEKKPFNQQKTNFFKPKENKLYSNFLNIANPHSNNLIKKICSENLSSTEATFPNFKRKVNSAELRLGGVFFE